MKLKSILTSVVLLIILGAAFLLLVRMIFPSDSFEYEYVVTERAVVTSSVGPPSKSRARNPSIMIKVENGLIVSLMVPTNKNYKAGELVKVDQFKAKGRKPVYRLAAEPIAP